MRFSIRDLLWATVVVAMGLGWWVSYRAVDANRVDTIQHAVQQTKDHRKALTQAKEIVDVLPSGASARSSRSLAKIETSYPLSDNNAVKI